MRKYILLIIFISVFTFNYAQDINGTFIDNRDNKSYKTVKIGDQIWMAENLAYKIRKKSWPFDDMNINIDKFGYLYNYEGALKACPTGWHLPSETEWNLLFYYLGGEKIAGGKLKSTTGWFNPNVGATNESGFSAIGAGERMYYGDFKGFGEVTYFWAKRCYAVSLNNKWTDTGCFSSYPTRGFYVRCIKD